ncbi:sarcoplasmic calcium-binding protein [Chelonus insularis]|uniref:sarcoplasmic calcium-binding protein n=1 Tax=Chelonus insularis TaxID=460826 RepID=UPI00158A49E7|nr:sarcoplasmic calcium-binding protein [Chelonus insularis]
MATALLRHGLRSVVAKSVSFEKRALPTICNTFFADQHSQLTPKQKFQFSPMLRTMSSKRNVHHTRASASVDEESDSDSDSDEERDRGQSEFWRRKMSTLHRHLDVNKDGVISYEDFMLLAERFADLGHLSPEAKKDFQKVLSDMWVEQWGEISPYNLVGVEQYLEEMHHVLNDPSLKKKCHHFLPFLFKAVDKDGDGEISVEEFKLFFRCLDIDNDHAVVSFTFIDVNEDGKITKDEFISLGRDFFLTEDHTRPSKHFWGPLAD